MRKETTRQRKAAGRGSPGARGSGHRAEGQAGRAGALKAPQLHRQRGAMPLQKVCAIGTLCARCGYEQMSSALCLKA